MDTFYKVCLEIAGEGHFDERYFRDFNRALRDVLTRLESDESLDELEARAWKGAYPILSWQGLDSYVEVNLYACELE